MKKLFCYAIYVMATLVMVFTMDSCKKENQNKETQFSTNQMLEFNSFEEVFDYMTRQNTKESNDKFLSYGKIADLEYEELSANNSFTTMDDLFHFVEQNKNNISLLWLRKMSI